ncbi:hypothetical protein AAF712_009255 [Marasmius tenuissimus]|uniref:Uncharacterized protein n=1 Tax=Marasmius tenuissimus TaxID=585030 RepID=A0ABR2ZQ61_9AGAR
MSGRFYDIFDGLLSSYGPPSSPSTGLAFTRGIRRGRDENDGEETTDGHYDLSGEALNSNLTRLMAAHPRPVAGSRRVYNSNFAVPNSSMAEPRGGEDSGPSGPSTLQQAHSSGSPSYVTGHSQCQPYIVQEPQYDQFSLPIGSEELGNPLCDAGGYRDFFQGYGRGGSETLVHTNRNMDYGYGASGWSGEGGNMMDAAGSIGSTASSSTQDLNDPNESRLDIFPSAFGNIGGGYHANTESTGLWNGWDQQMADLDEVLRSQGFDSISSQFQLPS